MTDEDKLEQEIEEIHISIGKAIDDIEELRANSRVHRQIQICRPDVQISISSEAAEEKIEILLEEANKLMDKYLNVPR